MAHDSAARHTAELEELSAYRLRAVERRLWTETGFDTSAAVLLAIRDRLTSGMRPDSAAPAHGGMIPAYAGLATAV